MANLIKNKSLPPYQKDGTGGSKTIVLAALAGKKVICKTFLPGDRMDPHHTPTDVFVLMLDGQMDISLDGTPLGGTPLGGTPWGYTSLEDETSEA